MLDLRRLEMLQRFSVLGSITATAAELGYSASAISQQLTTLEREAGVALIERTAHSAALTDAGRDLVAHAVIVLAAVEAAESRMHERAGTVSGHVEVSCIPGLAVQLASELAALQDQHPGLSLVARETESRVAAGAVLDGRCDLAVVDDWSGRSVLPASGLTSHELRREPILLAVPTDEPRAKTPTPLSAASLREVVGGYTWLCAPTGQQSRVASDIRLETAGVRPRRRWEFQGMNVLAALVAADTGVAFLPATIVANSPGLTGLPLRPQMQRRVLALTRTSRQEDPALASCLAAVQRALRLPPRKPTASAKV